jgi:hypothetical protein
VAAARRRDRPGTRAAHGLIRSSNKEIPMTTSPRLHTLAAALALTLLPLAAAAQNTLVLAKLNGDDQWKLYITTQITTDGYQYASGWGWPITYTASAWLPNTSAGTHFKDY